MLQGFYHFADDARALPELLQAWRAGHPDLGLLALLPEAEAAHIPALQAACRAAGIALVGAVFPALLGDAGFADRGIWLVRLDPMPPAFLVTDLDHDPGAAAAGVAAAVSALTAGRDADADPAMLFMLFDGMLPTVGSILNGVYNHLGSRVHYAGVNAGSETFQPMPCLFDSDRCVGNAVLGLLLPAATAYVVGHGYPVARSLMNATSAQGNRIDRIDGRPAFDVYRDVMRSEFGIELDHANFYDYAAHFPFGLVTAIDVLVRIPVAFNDDGSLFCVGEVPPNAKLRLLRAPDLAESRCVESLAGRLRERAGDPAGRSMLVFYCAGRRMHFGADAGAEIARLRAFTGVDTVAGALSLGEIDSLEEFGFPRFHNAALVCLL
ncbi:FIST signal transduction protein [Parasulfuritortus cantonensis]|nr:FIST C-terminal domain-containing protein [Parasulfuritortus cantonensis]